MVPRAVEYGRKSVKKTTTACQSPVSKDAPTLQLNSLRSLHTNVTCCASEKVSPDFFGPQNSIHDPVSYFIPLKKELKFHIERLKNTCR